LDEGIRTATEILIFIVVVTQTYNVTTLNATPNGSTKTERTAKSTENNTKSSVRSH
jgi:hypothetical protein